MMMMMIADATLPEENPTEPLETPTVSTEVPKVTIPEPTVSLPNLTAVIPATASLPTMGVSLPVLPNEPNERVSLASLPSSDTVPQAETLASLVQNPIVPVKKKPVKIKKDPPPPPKPLTPEEEVALRRKQKLQALWLNRVLNVVRWLILGAMGYGIYWLAQQPFWMITPQQVQFKGANILPASALLPSIEKELNRPLYTLHPQSIEATLKKQFPLISAVQIRRRLFPIGLDVQVNEHQPWALIYDPWEKDTVLSYYRQVFLPLHFPKQLHPWGTRPVAKYPMPTPYAFILETYQSMRFNGQRFKLAPQILPPDSLMIFTSTQWFRNIPQPKRFKFLKAMDRLLNGIKTISSVQVEALIYNQPTDALSLELRLENQPKQPVTVLLGGWDDGLFDRALRLKPLIGGLPFVKEAVGNEKAGSCYKQLDFRWGQNVTVALCNPNLLEKPTLDEETKPLVVVEDDDALSTTETPEEAMPDKPNIAH